jgi:hypothetical protein
MTGKIFQDKDFNVCEICIYEYILRVFVCLYAICMYTYESSKKIPFSCNMQDEKCYKVTSSTNVHFIYKDLNNEGMISTYVTKRSWGVSQKQGKY